jgi:hypothetical protein
MIESLQTDHLDKNDAQGDFKEQRRRWRKRSSSADQAKHIPLERELPTRRFFAPLRTAGMELDPTTGPMVNNSSRPIILTSTINLIQLQKQLKGLVEGSFEFRNTRNGTRIPNSDTQRVLIPYCFTGTTFFMPSTPKLTYNLPVHWQENPDLHLSMYIQYHQFWFSDINSDNAQFFPLPISESHIVETHPHIILSCYIC